MRRTTDKINQGFTFFLGFLFGATTLWFVLLYAAGGFS